MNITDEEIKQFADKNGKIDLVKVYTHRLAKAKDELIDKYYREGRLDLVEWL